MELNISTWSRDWENYSCSRSDSVEEELTDEEVIEFLRWMACYRPKKYVEVMTNFASSQGRRIAVGTI